MAGRGLPAASAVAAALAALVIVSAAPSDAGDQYWGALAYSPLDGASGTSSQQSTEPDARRAALLDCSDNGGSDCEVVVTVQRPDCASLVASESLYSWGVDEDPAEATRSGLADLGEPGREVASTCGFVAGASPAPIPSQSPVPMPPGFTHPHSPTPPPPAPIPPAPVFG